MELIRIVNNIFEHIVDPLINLAFIVAIIYFLWGLIIYVSLDSSSDNTKAKNIMIYGVIGLFILTSVKTIILFISYFTGASSIIL